MDLFFTMMIIDETHEIIDIPFISRLTRWVVLV